MSNDMNNYQVFHRSQYYQQTNRLIQANVERMLELQPDLVVDFTQCPRLFLAEKFADMLSAMEPIGVERVKNRYRPELDDEVQIDIGTHRKMEIIDGISYAYFYIFNRYDVIDPSATEWHCTVPSIGAIKKPVLDKVKLEAIPLQARLLFKLDQDPSYLFMHDSVVDKLLNAKMQDIWVRWGD